MDEETIIALDGVSVKAGYKYLLRNISWQVRRGEHWAVFGQNGSGKTTLLSVIAGFKQQTAGTVQVLGQAFTNDNILAIRRRIGWVSASFFDKYYTQESALHIVLSGLGGTLGLYDDITLDDVALAKALLGELGLGDKVDRTFDQLSKGERQNVLIARALISDPEILILDEPYTGLDVYNRSYLAETIAELSRQKALTIIYVTHYAEEITPLFGRTLLLKGGQVYAAGATEELLKDKVISGLLGHPAQISPSGEGYHLSIQAHSQLARLLGAKGAKEGVQ